MGIPDLGYTPEPNLSANCSLTLFFMRVVGALERLRANWEASLANEARRLCQGAMTKVLTKMAYWNPNLNFDVVLDSLSAGVDLTALKERIKLIISHIGEIERVEGQHRD